MTEVLTIAIDFDNTIAETVGLLCKKIHEEFGLSLSKDQVTIYHAGEVLGWTPEQEAAMFEKVWKDDRLQPTEPNIGNVIRKIRDTLGCRIVIISHRTPNSLMDPLRFLDKWGVHFDEYIPMLNGSKTDYDWQILIDDAYHNISEVREPRTGILVNQPWNRAFTHPFRINKLSDFALEVSQCNAPLRVKYREYSK